MKSQKVERFTARGFTAQQLAADLKDIPPTARAVDYTTESHSYTGDNAPTRFVQEIILTFEAPIKEDSGRYRIRTLSTNTMYATHVSGSLTKQEANSQLLQGTPEVGETRFLEHSDGGEGYWNVVTSWEFTGTSWKRK